MTNNIIGGTLPSMQDPPLQQKIFNNNNAVNSIFDATMHGRVDDPNDWEEDSLEDMYNNGVSLNHEVVQREIASNKLSDKVLEYRADKVYDTIFDNLDKLQRQFVELLVSQGVEHHRITEGVCHLMDDLYMALTVDSSHMHYDPNRSYDPLNGFLQQLLSAETNDPLYLLLQNNITLRMGLITQFNNNVRQKANKLSLELPDGLRKQIHNTELGELVDHFQLGDSIDSMMRNDGINFGMLGIGSQKIKDRVRSSVLATHFRVDNGTFGSITSRNAKVESLYTRLVSEEGTQLNTRMEGLTHKILQSSYESQQYMLTQYQQYKGIGRFREVMEGLVNPRDKRSQTLAQALEAQANGQFYDGGGDMMVDSVDIVINKNGMSIRDTIAVRDKDGQVHGRTRNITRGNSNAPRLEDTGDDPHLLMNTGQGLPDGRTNKQPSLADVANARAGNTGTSSIKIDEETDVLDGEINEETTTSFSGTDLDDLNISTVANETKTKKSIVKGLDSLVDSL